MINWNRNRTVLDAAKQMKESESAPTNFSIVDDTVKVISSEIELEYE